jgi:hypothetical protein
MRKELFQKRKKKGLSVALSPHKWLKSTHVNPGLSRGLYGVVDSHLYSNRTEETPVSQFSSGGQPIVASPSARSGRLGIDERTVVLYCT